MLYMATGDLAHLGCYYFTTDKFNSNLSEPAYLWPYTALYS